MVNEQDRAKILAFVHGELDQLETQKLATRIESEEPLRIEFEALLAASDSLEDLFLKPAKDDLSAKQVGEIMKQAKGGAKPPLFRKPTRSFYIAGGAVFAASLAFVVFMQVNTPTGEMAMNEPVVASAPEAAAPAPADPGGGVPPVDNLAPKKGADMHVADAGSGSGSVFGRAGRTAEASRISEKGVRMGGLAKNSAEDKGAMTSATEIAAATPPGSDAMAQTANEAESPQAGATQPMSAKAKGETRADALMVGAPAKKMGVIASRVKFKNMNNRKALLHLQQKLDGKPSCVPTALSMIKTMTVVITVDKAGLIKTIRTTPVSPEAVKCLKAKLGNKPPAFKPTQKSGGTISLQLKNF